MNNVYFLLIANKEELSCDSKFSIFNNGDQEYLAPILHVKSDDKSEIRKDLINSIDNMLDNI